MGMPTISRQRIANDKSRDSRWPLLWRRVTGESMYPTLEKGQWVLVRLSDKIAVDDIVMFVHSGAEKVKRVMGIEGDFIYVLGDNPRYSTDSRHYGYVKRHAIVGRVVWPRQSK